MEPPINEAFLVAIRITELEQDPVPGAFDVAHLCEVHRRIFQDLPQYHPGQFRPHAPTHVKARVLESLGVRYYVPYAPRNRVDAGITRTLSSRSPRDAQGMSLTQFASYMAQLYGDLDYWHPFVEGNSRTLRTFTRQWARQAGFVLDWGLSKHTESARDRLYIARDKEVLVRAFPRLTEARAMMTEDLVEYEAYVMLHRFRSYASLETLIREWTARAPDRGVSKTRTSEPERD